MQNLLVAAVLTVATLFSGCNKSPAEDDDSGPARTPKAVAFEGQVDAKFAGAWKSSDESTEFQLDKSGTLNLIATVSGPAGKATNKMSGEWRVSGKKLVLKYAKTGQEPTVVEYEYDLKGDAMALKQPGGRITTNFKRG